MSWQQDPDRIRKILSGRHQRVLAGREEVALATVSGVLTTKTPLVRYVDEKLPAFTVVTTKSFQVRPNPGNREPIICEPEAGSFGNSVGLKNPGMSVALEELQELRSSHTLHSLLNVSVSASTVEDFITLVGAFEAVADIIELNFSCPHASAGYGASIGCSPELSALYMREIRAAYPHCKALIFPKLTPNVPDIAQIAREVMDAGADGIVAINTVGPEIHRDAVSETPILQNSLGGKGGKSGLWILQDALACIQAIRNELGSQVPIIGMGGVATGQDIAAMVKAGADIVGVGSAFGKVNQTDWRLFTQALVHDANAVLQGSEDPGSAARWYRAGRSMEYRACTIVERTQHGEDTVVLKLDGSWQYEAGQFVFLWLPQVGEKPFSIAEHEPLTFVVKRRGAFTRAVFDLAEGDSLYIRGLYGAPVQVDATRRALLLAGGTGVAVLPALARRLREQNTEMEIFIGTSEVSSGVLESTLETFAPVTTIADRGKVGRVLDTLRTRLREIDVEDLSTYVVGPTPFMRHAVEEMVKAGVDPSRIHLSLELATLCGIGMCGECLCGDRLTCAWGTFMDYAYLQKEAPELI